MFYSNNNQITPSFIRETRNGAGNDGNGSCAIAYERNSLACTEVGSKIRKKSEKETQEAWAREREKERKTQSLDTREAIAAMKNEIERYSGAIQGRLEWT